MKAREIIVHCEIKDISDQAKSHPWMYCVCLLRVYEEITVIHRCSVATVLSVM